MYTGDEGSFGVDGDICFFITTYLRKRNKQNSLNFTNAFVLFKGESELMILCFRPYVRCCILYAHFASCEWSIKRIVDDPDSVFKLMLLHKMVVGSGEAIVEP